MVYTAQSTLGLETCMHLTCTNMKVELIDEALEKAFKSGCQNILALRETHLWMDRNLLVISNMPRI